MSSTEKLCRLCLRYVKGSYFDDLGEACDILIGLNLKVNMDISEEPVICIDCIESLRKLFSFKVTCVQSEDFFIPFIKSDDDKKIDFQQVCLEMNGSKSLDDKKFCRFCMCETPINSSLELNAVIDCMLPTMYLLEFFPELDMNLARDPIICKTCHNFLQDHLTFTRTCMSLEESIQKYVEVEGTNDKGKIDLKAAKQFMDKVIMKKEIEEEDMLKHEIQHDEIVQDASCKEDVKMESYIEIEDSQLEIKSESIEVKQIVNISERILEAASAESRENYNKHFMIRENIKCYSPEVTTPQCEIEYCSYETKRTDNLIPHKLINKNVPEIMTYKCGFEECLYVTKHKSNLNVHKLIHKDISEVMMYKCGFEGCLYQTKHKSYLTTHKLNHKDVSEVMTYKCGFEECLYETKHKSYLIRHMLVHKDPSEITMYKCDAESCSYESKFKFSLVRHKLMHKDISEVMMYKCGLQGCLYESKHKTYLIKHKLIHKNPSKVTMYKCGIEGCPHETKHKSNLIKHKLIHKDVSEVMM